MPADGRPLRERLVSGHTARALRRWHKRGVVRELGATVVIGVALFAFPEVVVSHGLTLPFGCVLWYFIGSDHARRRAIRIAEGEDVP